MELTVKIENKGNQIGTVGWLAKNAAKLRVGTSKHGCRGVWLDDHDGKTIDTLAIAGFNGAGDDSISRVERVDTIGFGVIDNFVIPNVHSTIFQSFFLCLDISFCNERIFFSKSS